MIDEACAGITDPAEVFSLWLGLSVLLGRAHPEVARFITGAGLDSLRRYAAWRRGPLGTSRPVKHAGQFTVPGAVVALSAVAGGLIGSLRLHQSGPKRVDETAVDQLAEACLRLLGLPAAKAKRLAVTTPAAYRALVTAIR